MRDLDESCNPACRAGDVADFVALGNGRLVVTEAGEAAVGLRNGSLLLASAALRRMPTAQLSRCLRLLYVALLMRPCFRAPP
jgi:hypothetical protein